MKAQRREELKTVGNTWISIIQWELSQLKLSYLKYKCTQANKTMSMHKMEFLFAEIASQPNELCARILLKERPVLEKITPFCL